MQPDSSATKIAMHTISAGILLFRMRNASGEVFLVHPGGPYWAHKNIGSWSVPKGIVNPGEDEFACARREFREETGFDIAGRAISCDLGTFRLSGSKSLHVWSVEGDCDPAELVSNAFEIEWPPQSGHRQRFPEVDRGEWFDRAEAEQHIVRGQRPIIEAFYNIG
jgi:predicted NUDIX family NTP pyrophosphohydrolase